MYRTGDPRFRRRLTELGQTLENANESAQSGLYIFGQTYIKPCFESVTSGLTTCVDASCPSLNLAQRDQARRQRGRARSRGRAELNFDFYDDWDDDENEGLLGWGNDEFDSLVIGGDQGYGTVTNTQPARQRGMSYPKARRKSGVPGQEGSVEQSAIPGSTFFTRLFGGKAVQYRPSAANLQEHPGARRLDHDLTEGEALLGDIENGEGGKSHRRMRSSTVGSGHTTDSLSSRGDIFPSDGEDDAVPLDDEFAMVLERRHTQSGPETDSASGNTRSPAGGRKRGKRSSTGSRASTRRTISSRSARSSFGRVSGTTSRRSSGVTPEDTTANITLENEADTEDEEAPEPPTLSELKREEQMIEQEEEAEVQRRRREAQRLAAERGLVETNSNVNPNTIESDANVLSSKEATPRSSSPPPPPPSAASPIIATTQQTPEPNQLPTPIATDDEDEARQNQPSNPD